MKRIICFALLILMMIPILGCEKSATDDHSDAVIPGQYVYEGKGATLGDVGAFWMEINEDGTFSYYEGFLSSYYGIGEWRFEDGILTLTDDGSYNIVNRFRVMKDRLVFIEEGSRNFLYVKVKNGECFYRTAPAETKE